MCGIVFCYSHAQAIREQPFMRALRALRHRGPDGQGHWFSATQQVALGHARLAINGGAWGGQPLCLPSSPNGVHSWAAVINGEIYNTRETLFPSTHAAFTTESDSEVLLRQVMEHGPEGLAMLDGEFAFALWHEATQTGYLGRDPHGVKPLYYTWHQGQLVAASEIKALLAYGVPARWNADYLAQAPFFVYSAKQTIVHGVYALPPGHCLHVCQGQATLVPYSNPSPLLPQAYPADGHMPFEEACTQFEALLKTAVQNRLCGHLPNSTYLSSGIDSSLITAIAAQEDPKLTAYSIGFHEPAFDESKAAQAIAQHLGIAHDILLVNEGLLARYFVEAISHCEMAVPNMNVVAKFCMSQVLKNHGKKLVLTGEGADESLVGYGFLRQDAEAPYLRQHRLPAPLQKLMVPVFTQLGYAPAQLVHSAGTGLELRQLLREPDRANPYASLLDHLQKHPPSNYNRLVTSQALHYHSAFQYYNLGALADRTEMAHGIEGRPPFLAPALVDFVHGLPAAFKVQHGQDKRILREVAKTYLPREMTTIPKKPFLAPASPYSTQGELQDLFNAYFSTLQHLPEIYDKPKVKQWYQQRHFLSQKLQAAGEPAAVYLLSVMVLQERLGLTL